MNGPWQITAAAGLDERGLVGARGVVAAYDPGHDPGERLRWQAVSQAPYPDFRRLDPLGKAMVMTAELLDADAFAPLQRRRTAVLFGTEYGCLCTDLRFAASLAGPAVAAGLFAFTLPSTALGAVALRHGLGGPTLALSLPAARQHEALGHARDLLSSGAAEACLCCLGDWLPAAEAARAGAPARTKIVALLLAPGDPPPEALVPDGLPQAADAVACILEHLRRERPPRG